MSWTTSAFDCPDMRPLSDALWPDDSVRTEQMRRLVPLFEAWLGWTDGQRADWAQAVALRTVREILPIALRAAKIDEALVLACEQAQDLDAAGAAAGAAAGHANVERDAARAARYASDAAGAAAGRANVERDAANAARAAANAARYASDAADAAASYAVLALAVTIWAEETEKVA